MIVLPNPPAGGYKTIVVDPPWEYQNNIFQVTSRKFRLTENQYQFLTLEEIRQLPIESLAAQDARLYLWTTQKYLPYSFTLLEDWGFCYRWTFVWHKQNGGLQLKGIPNSDAEFILQGNRGNPRFLDNRDFATVLTAPKSRHSEKPAYFYELLARVTPGPRIDLFARRRHPGFDAWGDQVDDWCQGNLGMG